MNGRFLRNLVCVIALATFAPMTAVNAEAQARQASVTGRITDVNGSAVAGATIVVAGGGGGAISGTDGSYGINAAPTATLTVSLVGFATQNVAVENRSVVNIVLEPDAKAIEDVVVTAMGLSREKRTLGYAMTELGGEEIARANVVNPVQGLQGKVAGVQIDMGAGGPQASQRIVIRGNTSLSGNNQPIFIIDGIIVDNEVTKTGDKFDLDFGNALKSLNADDFETMSVLKGAAATALYGSRASNGVILITTKKGKKQEGLGVSFSQTMQVESVYKFPDLQNEYGMGISPLWALKDGQEIRSIDATSLNWGPKYDGKPYSTGDYNGTWKAQPNNLDPLFRNGAYRNTNVAVQGGTDRSTFRFSYSNMKDEGLSPNNSMGRNTFSFKGSQQISKILSAEASFTYTSVDARNPTPQGGDSSPIYDFMWAVPRDYDTQYWVKNYWSANRDGYNNSDPFNYTSRLFNLFENNQIKKEDYYRGYVKLDVNLTKWLKLSMNADMNNFYSRYEKKTLATGHEKFTGAEYILNDHEKKQHRVSATLTANKNFGNINLGGYIGAESYKEKTGYNNSKTNNGLRVPGLFALYNSIDPVTTEALSVSSRKTLNSIYGAVNFDWKSQLYVEMTARNDWSSALQYRNGKGNVSYFYPSINTSWLVHETFDLPHWVSFLKLRASYAIVGKDCDVFMITDPGTYQFSNVYSDTKYGSGSYAYYNLANSDLGAANLKPEKQHAIEFGADLRLFNDRLGVDFAYYKTNTYNQIIRLAMSQESGVANRIINAGNIQNQGIELLITGVPVRTRDWRWDLSLNLTRNRNKIIKLADGIQKYQLPGGDTFDVEAWATVGGSYGDIYTSHTFKRDAEGNKLLNASGQWLRSGVSTKVGSIQPDLLGGLSSTLAWKSLSFGFTLDSRFGGDIYSSSYYYGKYTGKLQSTLDVRTNGLERKLDDGRIVNDGMIPDGVFDKGVTLTHPVTKAKVDVSGQTYQEAVDQGLLQPMSAYQYHKNGYDWGSGIRDNGIMDCSWIALRDVSLSWAVPNRWTEKAYIRNLVVSLNVRNVCYLYNSLPDGIYPDALLNNYSSQFREGGGRPYSRRYGFTVSLNF